MENQPEKKKNRQKNIIILLIIVVIVIAGGALVFINWQNRSQTLQTTNRSQTHLPTSGEREIKRPTLETGEPNHISIPDRNIETPVIYVDETNEEVFQDALAQGVVHYPGSALPGEPGNPYIFGHSSDFFWKPGDYKEVFKLLVDIPLDTIIKITNKEGELFVYKVIETKIVGPKDVSVLNQYDYKHKMLTLQTSWPVGTALKRYIVIAELDEEATYGSEDTTQ